MHTARWTFPLHSIPQEAPELRVPKLSRQAADTHARVWSNLADHLLTGVPVACPAAGCPGRAAHAGRLAQCMEEAGP